LSFLITLTQENVVPKSIPIIVSFSSGDGVKFEFNDEIELDDDEDK